MARIAKQIEDRNLLVFQTVVVLALDSIKFGSELTGAPGQPVDTGALKNSWVHEFTSPTTAIVASANVEYAEAVENGVNQHGPMTLRSMVGGFHSVAHTITNFDRLLAAAAAAHPLDSSR